MLRVTTTVTGIDALVRAMQARGAQASVAVREGLLEAGAAVQSEAQRLIADPPKSGRLYRKYNPRRDHQASAPGEAPATDTGGLIAGVVLDTTDVPAGSIVVASTAPYSRPLEFGTARMAARPFLRRAAEHMRPRIVALLAAALRARGFR